MGLDKLIHTSSSPPIYSDCLNAHTGSTACRSKETSSANIATMLYTRLRKQFTQIKNQTHHGRRHHYQQLNSVSNTAEATTVAAAAPTPPSARSRLGSVLSLISITTLILSTLITTVSANPVFVDNPSLAQFQSGRNIRHLPCIVRKSGRSGVCMFAIDCIKQNGTHLGTCIDRFYFGSCCDIKEEGSLFAPEIADNSIDQNTISHHFTSESTTMPTSALFKLTTLGPFAQNHTVQQDQDSTQMSNTVTQQDTQRPSTHTTSGVTTKPSKVATTSKPQQSNTHKHSHFVIRTTAKPTKTSTVSKPSYITTNATRKKTSTSTTTTTTTTTTSTTTTTTARPMLTTTPEKVIQDALLIEGTTQPTKLFTFQTVETTVATPTEPPRIVDIITTERLQTKTTKAPPRNTISHSTVNTTTHRTTPKPKPQNSRKPSTTKKPSQIKRTTVKPSRKPVTSTTAEPLRPQIQSSTTTIATNTSTATPSSTNIATASIPAPTSSQTNITMTSHKTTAGPRPKPKPTATVNKIPKPTTSTSKPTQRPTTTSREPIVTTETIKHVETSTVATSTSKPLSAQSTTQSVATSTEAPTSMVLPVSSTTLRPGLVTWTNVDAEPASPNKPSASDWIPVTTAGPDRHNTTHVPPPLVSTSAPELSTSTGEAVNDNPIFTTQSALPTISQTSFTSTTPLPTTGPKEPATTTVMATTSTEKPTRTTTTTERPVTTTVTAAEFTTGRPISSTTATEAPQVTESQHSTTDSGVSASTEVPLQNATAVTTPTNTLEGVDYRQVCGRRMFPEPRIVGGSNAAFGRWPWQISLRQWRTSTYLHKCGAALLNENWAITAAHCVDNVPPSDLLLRLGEYDLAEEEEPYGYQERRVQIVASHPQFDPRTFEYDLALLRFYEPVAFQPNIIPVCVPESDEDFIGQTAFVTGWGRLYEDGPLPSVLQEVAVPVINNTICESMYRAAGYIEHIPHIFICAGWKKGGYDSCEGDSGGPMVLQRESDKRFQLGGVISWGIGCAEANQPGVYTRISEFRDWINQILQF